MSTHIKMNEDNFSQITTYHGTLDEKYTFVVELSYNSNRIGYNIDSIEFIAADNLYSNKSKKYWSKAEEKIKDFVIKWLFKGSKDELIITQGDKILKEMIEESE